MRQTLWYDPRVREATPALKSHHALVLACALAGCTQTPSPPPTPLDARPPQDTSHGRDVPIAPDITDASAPDLVVLDTFVDTSTADIALDAGEPPLPPADTGPGLRAVSVDDAPPTTLGTGHLARMLLVGDRLYVANSSDGVMTWSLASSGQLSLLSSTRPLRRDPATPEEIARPVTRCTALAVHTASNTLYCTAADAALGWFSLADRDHPAQQTGSDVSSELRRGYRDALVVGDALLLAGFDRGLLRATIARDGTPGTPAPTEITGDIIALAGDGDTLALLDRRRGLVSFRVENGSVRERGVLALDGPPLGLRVHGTRAAVALGSQGVALVDLAPDAPAITRRVPTTAVATAADFDGPALVVATLTGTWLYDLTRTQTRVAGFDVAEFGALDVLLTPGGRRALAIDWRKALSFDVNLDGHAVLLDADTGYQLRRGDEAVVHVRNPGDIRLTFSVQVNRPGGANVVVYRTIEPGETVRAVVPWSAIEPALDVFSSTAVLRVISWDAAGTQRERQGMLVVGVPNADTARATLVTVGDRFPVLTRRDGASGPAQLPASGRTAMAFVLPDCALQWPALEDLAWLARRGRAPRGYTPVVITISYSPREDPWYGTVFPAMWSLAPLDTLAFGDYSASAAGGGGRPSAEVFDTRFTTRFAGGADFTDVVYTDETGLVRDVERLYRGAWSFGR
jgi:hypothetical protein